MQVLKRYNNNDETIDICLGNYGLCIARGYIAFLTTVPKGKEMEECIGIYMASPVLQGYYLCLRKICYPVVAAFLQKICGY